MIDLVRKAEAERDADRERLRRLVAAVRRHVNHSEGCDGYLPCRERSALPREQWCAFCAMLAELEACEEAE